MNARMGAAPWLARTQLEYAELLLDSGLAADAEHGSELAGRAAAAAHELGIASLARRAERLVARPAPVRVRVTRS
jgi:hypothetical protein